MMDVDGLLALLSLFEMNAKKLKSFLSVYQLEVNTVRETLVDSLFQSSRADSHIISIHDALLKSVNEINEIIIKLNFYLNISRPVDILQTKNEETPFAYHENEICRNLNDVEIGESDVYSSESKQQDKVKPCSPVTGQSVCDVTTANLPMLPVSTRETKLKPPKGGIRMTVKDIYNELNKNIGEFVEDTVVQVTITSLNLVDNCVYVTKLSDNTTPILKLLNRQMPVEVLEQLPNFGEVFAVYDTQEQIIPRVVMYDYAKGGGYDAYLLDYGEHIQLNGEEVIYSIPDEIKVLPAAAVRCYIRNRKVENMRQLIYKDLQILVLYNSGSYIEAVLLDNETSETNAPDTANLNSNSMDDKEKLKDDNTSKAMLNGNDVKESISVLSPEDLEFLENIYEGTSDPLKAVLGYKPKDAQRICRFYNPKIKGCFKGSSCRLLHQEFAPNGTTKDTQLVESMPETIYISSAPRPLGEVVRVLVTYVNSPTHLYVQFVGDGPPLVWSKEELAGSEINLQFSPRVLEMVLALYNDGCYYRAQIIEEIDGLYKIFYVDYGNTNFVTMKDLAKCSDAISLKPHQANQCFIQGIKLSPSLSELKKDECMQLLNSKILNTELDIKLGCRLPDGYGIEFLNSFADLPKQMVKRGYVDPMSDEFIN